MTLPTSGGGWVGEKEHGMEANKERYGEIKKEGIEKRGGGEGERYEENGINKERCERKECPRRETRNCKGGGGRTIGCEKKERKKRKKGGKKGRKRKKKRINRRVLDEIHWPRIYQRIYRGFDSGFSWREVVRAFSRNDFYIRIRVMR